MKRVLILFICLVFVQNLFGQTSWTTSASGIASGFMVKSFTVLQTKVYAVGSKSNSATLYESSNNGTTWTAMTTTGLENFSYDYTAICTVGSSLLLSARDGVGNPAVFKSIDNGSTWTLSNTGLSGVGVDYFAVTTSGLVFATHYGGFDVYQSSDSGNSWTSLIATAQPGVIYGPICADGNDLYLTKITGGPSQIYKSSDNGSSWLLSNFGIEANFGIHGLASTPAGVYLTGYSTLSSTAPSKMYLSKDNGASWEVDAYTGLGGYEYSFIAMCSIGNDLLLSANDMSFNPMVFRSTITTPAINGKAVVDVNVFPNPAKDVITISTDNLSQEYQVVICDLTGNTVLISYNEPTIDISSLKNGMYVVKVIDGNKTGITRIIVQ